MKRVTAAMIIGLALGCSTGITVAAGQPDPVTFAVQMENGNLDQARAWLDEGLDPNFLGSRVGSGLMIGAWEGNIPLMELFLSRGADINRPNANGETPLALAAWKGRQEAVQWLLQRGARINGPKGQWSALHYAVFSGHKDLSNYLIERGADINAQSRNGSTVLMMAIYEGHEDLARTLIDKGAQVALKNDWGDGALEWAMRFNRLELARRIASADQYRAAVNQPKESWGEARRSLKSSPELERLLRTREILAEKGMSLETVDTRIAAERARIARSELKREALPPRAVALEITASRKAPQDQSAKVVYGPDGKPQGNKLPGTGFTGTARMPPKAPVKNY